MPDFGKPIRAPLHTIEEQAELISLNERIRIGDATAYERLNEILATSLARAQTPRLGAHE